MLNHEKGEIGLWLIRNRNGLKTLIRKEAILTKKQIPIDMLTYSPVELIDTGSKRKYREKGIALCLSVGGYRAMLFHLGALWRLNELGYLKKLNRISSVSGGSISAVVLGYNWSKLAFDDAGIGQKFVEEVVEPIRKLACRTIDVRRLERRILLKEFSTQANQKAYSNTSVPLIGTLSLTKAATK